MSWYERHIFNPLLDRGLRTSAMQAERERLLAHSSGRLLEVGPGTGLNFPHYPPEIERITTISPDEELPAIARERAAERGATLQHFCKARPPWPLADGLFDTIACTLVLCSVPDVAEMLREFRRVLVPGGKFLVFEHVLSERPMQAAAQHALTPFTRLFGCGCHANRRTRQAIEEAGFSWDLVESRDSEALPKPLATTVFGVARSPEA